MARIRFLPLSDQATTAVSMNQNSLPRRVGIWIRVSTEMQAQGDSPEHHEKRAREYAESRGWQVIESYRLSGVSGSVSLSHPEGVRMIGDIERGHITALIASKFARIARDGIQFRLLHRRFKAVGADIVSLDENIDTSTPAGELILGIIADLAEWERKEIASRVRASIKPRARAGTPLGGDGPYGYQWQDRKLVPNPAEAPVRRLIHELFIKVRRKRTVARMLNEQGHRTRKGRLWSYGAVDWLLRDPSAKGLYRRNYVELEAHSTHWRYKPASEVVYLKVEPIMPAEIWDKAYAVLMETTDSMRAAAKATRHLLSGFVVCECGQKMYGAVDRPFLRCWQPSECSNRIPVVSLEHMLGELMRDRLYDPGLAKSFCKSATKHLKAVKERIADLRCKEEKAKHVIQRAFDMVVEGRMPESRYQTVCEPHEKLLLESKKEMSDLESEARALEGRPLETYSVLGEVRRVFGEWDRLPILERRALLESNQLEIKVKQKEHVVFTLLYHPIFETAAKEQRTIGLSEPAAGSKQVVR
jgi:site-specific DNA recombinase